MKQEMSTEMKSWVTMALIFLGLMSCRVEAFGATVGFLQKHEHLPGGHCAAPPIPMRLRGGMWKGQSSTPDDKVFTKADQDDLNRYAGLNFRSKELMLELEDSQGILDGLKMSKDEVALMDPKDPDFKFKWASVYSDNWTPEALEVLLMERIEGTEQQIRDKEQDLEEIRGDMAVIGARLKGRFGDEVRLDDESEEQ